MSAVDSSPSSERWRLAGDTTHGREPSRERREAAARSQVMRAPEFADYAVDALRTRAPAGVGDTHVLGRFLRDVAAMNAEQRNFRIFGPDETCRTVSSKVFEATNRQWQAPIVFPPMISSRGPVR